MSWESILICNVMTYLFKMLRHLWSEEMDRSGRTGCVGSTILLDLLFITKCARMFPNFASYFGLNKDLLFRSVKFRETTKIELYPDGGYHRCLRKENNSNQQRHIQTECSERSSLVVVWGVLKDKQKYSGGHLRISAVWGPPRFQNAKRVFFRFSIQRKALLWVFSDKEETNRRNMVSCTHVSRDLPRAAPESAGLSRKKPEQEKIFGCLWPNIHSHLAHLTSDYPGIVSMMDFTSFFNQNVAKPLPAELSEHKTTWTSMALF